MTARPSFLKMKLVEFVSERIVEINLQRTSSHGHGYEALSIVPKLKPIFRLTFVEALEGLGPCSACDKMNRAAAKQKKLQC